MARICIERRWYEQVEPSTFSEDEFEKRVMLHAPSVYPLYHVLLFKQRLKLPSNNKAGYEETIPDIIFISRDYTDWWICEVEMGYHSFKAHVKPQITRLLNSVYGDDELDYICQKHPELDRDKIRDLFRNPVKVIVIVNQNMPKWKEGWPEGRVVFAVFELFKSMDREDRVYEVFRVNGEYPAYLKDKLSECSFHPRMPRLLQVHQPERIDLPREQVVHLLYNNCITEWQRMEESGLVYITSRYRFPLSMRFRYSIHARSDGQLILHPERLTDLSPDEEDEE